jgi:hypothetical protein
MRLVRRFTPGRHQVVRWSNGFDMLCGDVIPLKFQRHAGLADYRFKLENGRSYQGAEDSSGWKCSISQDNTWIAIRLPYIKFPCETEVLRILAPIDGECEREYRYVKIHSAYECLFSKREVDFSAIRHALAHPSTSLRDAAVIKSLERRFGGSRLDLHNYHHQKEVYRCIGQMLIAIDRELYERIHRRWVDVAICAD